MFRRLARRHAQILLGEHVQGEGVDALLVDDDERLALLAHAALELDDLRGATGFGGGGASSLRRRCHRRDGQDAAGRTCFTLSSVNLRSLSMSLSRCSAFA